MRVVRDIDRELMDLAASLLGKSLTTARALVDVEIWK